MTFSELGVLSWRLDADKYENDEELNKIRESRSYLYMVYRIFIYNIVIYGLQI